MINYVDAKPYVAVWLFHLTTSLRLSPPHIVVFMLAAEATFLPRPESNIEDDGVLLSIVMSHKGMSFLLVLDASNMQELARAELPYAVPYRFHGGFLPKAA